MIIIVIYELRPNNKSRAYPGCITLLYALLN